MWGGPEEAPAEARARPCLGREELGPDRERKAVNDEPARRNSRQGSGSSRQGRANAHGSRHTGGPLCQADRDAGKMQKRVQ